MKIKLIIFILLISFLSSCSLIGVCCSKGFDYCHSGRRQEGIAEYEKSLIFEPDNECLLFNLATCAINAGELQTAKRAIERLQLKGANSYGFYRAAGELYYKLNDLDLAHYYLTQATHIKEVGRDFHLLARVASKQKKDTHFFWSKAAELYKKELKSQPNNEKLWHDYAMANNNIGNKKKYRYGLERSLLINPNYSPSKILLDKLKNNNKL